MTASEPFWRAPRRLRRLLEDGELTPTQYALLHYVGEAGGDRERFATSQGFLAELLRVDKKTIQRGFKRLRELRLIDHDLAAGKSVFHIWLGPEALVAEANPEANLGHPSDTTSDTPRTLGAPPMSEVTSDTPPPEKTRKAAPAKGSRRRPTSDTSRAGAETETETETETKSKSPDVGEDTERRAREVGGGDGDVFAATANQGGEQALSEQSLIEVCQSSYGRSPEEAFEGCVKGFELSEKLRARAWLLFAQIPDALLMCSHRMRGTPKLFSAYVEEALGNGGQPLGPDESAIFEANEPSDEQKALYGLAPSNGSVVVAEPEEPEPQGDPDGWCAQKLREMRQQKAAQA